jgi:putative ABC transport system permease protein
MAAHWLKSDRSKLPPPEVVQVRKQWINQEAVDKFNLSLSSGAAKQESAASNFYFTALMLGLAFVPLALGIFITLRIFNIPDITTDGSYTLGAAVTAAGMIAGFSPVSVLLLAILSGMTAGSVTGWIHTRLNVQPLLAGILVMTALYSVNLIIMGRSNIPLTAGSGIFGDSTSTITTLLMFVVFFGGGMMWLLRTDFGLAMRATGSSEKMIRSMGVNTDNMKVVGLAIANALTAVSGYLVAQFQSYADINMGIGIVISGLAAVMLGESVLRFTRGNAIWMMILSVIAGSILFRLLLAWILSLGMDPNYLKLVTAGVVLIVVSLKRSKS